MGGLARAEEALVADAALDPDLLRSAFLLALEDHPEHVRARALAAVARGELDLEDRPDEGSIMVQVGDVTVTVDRSTCTDPRRRPDPDPAPQ